MASCKITKQDSGVYLVDDRESSVFNNLMKLTHNVQLAQAYYDRIEELKADHTLVEDDHSEPRLYYREVDRIDMHNYPGRKESYEDTPSFTTDREFIQVVLSSKDGQIIKPFEDSTFSTFYATRRNEERTSDLMAEGQDGKEAIRDSEEATIVNILATKLRDKMAMIDPTAEQVDLRSMLRQVIDEQADSYDPEKIAEEYGISDDQATLIYMDNYETFERQLSIFRDESGNNIDLLMQKVEQRIKAADASRRSFNELELEYVDEIGHGLDQVDNWTIDNPAFSEVGYELMNEALKNYLELVTYPHIYTTQDGARSRPISRIIDPAKVHDMLMRHFSQPHFDFGDPNFDFVAELRKLALGYLATDDTLTDEELLKGHINIPLPMVYGLYLSLVGKSISGPATDKQRIVDPNIVRLFKATYFMNTIHDWTLQIDPDISAFRFYRSNRDNIAQLQVRSWQEQWLTSNNARKLSSPVVLRDFTSKINAVINAIERAPLAAITGSPSYDLEATISMIQNNLFEVFGFGGTGKGVNRLSREYIRYNIIKSAYERQMAGTELRHGPQGEKTREYLSSFQLEDTHLLSRDNLLNIFAILKQSTSGDTADTIRNPYSRRSEETDTETISAIARIVNIAQGNAFFDESIYETSFKNAEGKQIWAFQKPSYMTYFTSRLRDPEFRDKLKGVLGSNPTIKDFRKSNPYLTNHYLLNLPEEIQKLYFDDIAYHSIMSMRQTVFSLDSASTEGDGITHKHNTGKSFEIARLTMFSARNFDKNMLEIGANGVRGEYQIRRAMFFTRQLESKTTAGGIVMPIGTVLRLEDTHPITGEQITKWETVPHIEGGKLSENALRIMHTQYMAESRRINDRGQVVSRALPSLKAYLNGDQNSYIGGLFSTDVKIVPNPDDLQAVIPVEVIKNGKKVTENVPDLDKRMHPRYQLAEGIGALGNSFDIKNFEGLLTDNPSDSDEIKKLKESERRKLDVFKQRVLNPNVPSRALSYPHMSEQTFAILMQSLMDQHIEQYKDLLSDLGILKDNTLVGVGTEDKISHQNTLKNDYNGDVNALLEDFVANSYINSLLFNDLTDGDPATRQDAVDRTKRGAGNNAYGTPFNVDFNVSYIEEAMTGPLIARDEKGKVIPMLLNDELIKDNRADGQGRIKFSAWRKTLSNIGRQPRHVSAILNKIEVGLDIDQQEMKILRNADAVPNTVKDVYFDGEVYHKDSLNVLTKRFTSMLIPRSRKEAKKLQHEILKSMNRRDRLDANSDKHRTLSETIGKKLLVLEDYYMPRPGQDLLHNLRQDMIANSVDLVLYTSASKLKTPIFSRQLRDKNGKVLPRYDLRTSMRTIQGEFHKLQVETPSGKNLITYFSQMLQLITAEQNETTPYIDPDGQVVTVGQIKDQFRKTYRDITRNSVNEVLNMFSETTGVLAEEEVDGKRQYTKESMDNFRSRMLGMLKNSAASDAMLDIFRDPDFNLNMANTVTKFDNLLMVLFGVKVLKHKAPGGGLILTSDHGFAVVREKATGKVIPHRRIDADPLKYMDEDGKLKEEYQADDLKWESPIISRKYIYIGTNGKYYSYDSLLEDDALEIQDNVEWETFTGRIKRLKNNEVFVFGSNAAGFHGAGAAGYATSGKDNFNWRLAKYSEDKDGTKGHWNVKGQQGLQRGTHGESYALQTVEGVKQPLSEDKIKENIRLLYVTAKQNMHKKFYVAYNGKNPNARSLNTYTAADMARMFKEAGVAPANIVFEEAFSELVGRGDIQQTVQLRQVYKSGDVIQRGYAEMTVGAWDDFVQNPGQYKYTPHQWDKITKGFGVRIPTQDKQQMVAIDFVDFLPAYMGDAGVVPYQIFHISGADTDVDKLYYTRKAYYVDDERRIHLHDEKDTFEAYRHFQKDHNDNLKEAYTFIRDNSPQYRALLEDAHMVNLKLKVLFNEFKDTMDVDRRDPASIRQALDFMMQLDDVDGAEQAISSRFDIDEASELKSAIDLLLSEDNIAREIRDLQTEFKKMREEKKQMEDKFFIMAMKALNLPSSRGEYQALGGGKNNYALYNKLMDHSVGLLMNRSMDSIANTPATRKLLRGGSYYTQNNGKVRLSALDELLNGKTSSNYDFNAPAHQHALFVSNSTGADNIGVVAIANVVKAFLMDTHTDSMKRIFYLRDESPYFKTSATTSHSAWLEKSGSSAKWTTQKHRVRIFDEISTFITEMTDNGKHNGSAVFSLFRHNLGVYMSMLSAGVGVPKTMLFAKQPIMIAYNKEMFRRQSPIKSEEEVKNELKTIDYLFSDLFSELIRKAEAKGRQIRMTDEDISTLKKLVKKGPTKEEMLTYQQRNKNQPFDFSELAARIERISNTQAGITELNDIWHYIAVQKNMFDQFLHIKDEISPAMRTIGNMLGLSKGLKGSLQENLSGVIEPLFESTSKSGFLLEFQNGNGPMIQRNPNATFLLGEAINQRPDVHFNTWTAKEVTDEVARVHLIQRSEPYKDMIGKIRLNIHQKGDRLKQLNRLFIATLNSMAFKLKGGVSGRIKKEDYYFELKGLKDSGKVTSAYQKVREGSAQPTLLQRIRKLAADDDTFKSNAFIQSLNLNIFSQDVVEHRININSFTSRSQSNISELSRAFRQLYETPQYQELAEDLFEFLFMKDGLLLRSGSYLNYIAPELFKQYSTAVDEVQATLNSGLTAQDLDARFLRTFGKTPQEIVDSFTHIYLSKMRDAEPQNFKHNNIVELLRETDQQRDAHQRRTPNKLNALRLSYKDAHLHGQFKSIRHRVKSAPELSERQFKGLEHDLNTLVQNGVLKTQQRYLDNITQYIPEIIADLFNAEYRYNIGTVKFESIYAPSVSREKKNIYKLLPGAQHRSLRDMNAEQYEHFIKNYRFPRYIMQWTNNEKKVYKLMAEEPRFEALYVEIEPIEHRLFPYGESIEENYTRDEQLAIIKNKGKLDLDGKLKENVSRKIAARLDLTGEVQIVPNDSQSQVIDLAREFSTEIIVGSSSSKDFRGNHFYYAIGHPTTEQFGEEHTLSEDDRVVEIHSKDDFTKLIDDVKANPHYNYFMLDYPFVKGQSEMPMSSIVGQLAKHYPGILPSNLVVREGLLDNYRRHSKKIAIPTDIIPTDSRAWSSLLRKANYKVARPHMEEELDESDIDTEDLQNADLFLIDEYHIENFKSVFFKDLRGVSLQNARKQSDEGKLKFKEEYLVRQGIMMRNAEKVYIVAPLLDENLVGSAFRDDAQSVFNMARTYGEKYKRTKQIYILDTGKQGEMTWYKYDHTLNTLSPIPKTKLNARKELIANVSPVGEGDYVFTSEEMDQYSRRSYNERHRAEVIRHMTEVVEPRPDILDENNQKDPSCGSGGKAPIYKSPPRS